MTDAGADGCGAGGRAADGTTGAGGTVAREDGFEVAGRAGAADGLGGGVCFAEGGAGKGAGRAG